MVRIVFFGSCVDMVHTGKVATYAVDAEEIPIPSASRDFIAGLTIAQRAFVGPMASDFLFSTLGGDEREISVQGFKAPNRS